jgi:hypothetical protein
MLRSNDSDVYCVDNAQIPILKVNYLQRLWVDISIAFVNINIFNLEEAKDDEYGIEASLNSF